MKDIFYKKIKEIYDGEIIELENTTSTNTIASDAAKEGRCCLVVAARQSAGKGRFDRSFESKDGGLYMSLSIKSKKDPSEITDYPILAGEEVKEILENIIREKEEKNRQNIDVIFKIKHPNDVLAYSSSEKEEHAKKICGILMEAIPHDEDLFIIFGIGINLTNILSEELTEASNLKDIAGIELKPDEVCAAIVEKIVKRFG